MINFEILQLNRYQLQIFACNQYYHISSAVIQSITQVKSYKLLPLVKTRSITSQKSLNSNQVNFIIK